VTPAEIAEIRRRAAAGDTEAIAFTAVLAALGVGEAQDWAVAVERLARAAELGSTSAQGQLAVLARRDDAQGDWRALAAGIDMGGWLTRPERERLLSDPRIAAVRGFLPAQVCDWLIRRAAQRVQPALVFDPATGGARREQARSNSAFEFSFVDLDVVTAMVRARIAATVSTPTGALEPIQVLHYAPGQTFERHHDFLDVSVPGYAAQVAAAGQRIVTFLVYLNEGYEGGETDFPIVGLRFKGARGDALIFSNVNPAGAPDRRTLHAGLPPTSGEKWLLSQWIRDRVRG
jgi:prolyl 4-hydroxylase